MLKYLIVGSSLHISKSKLSLLFSSGINPIYIFDIICSNFPYSAIVLKTIAIIFMCVAQVLPTLVREHVWYHHFFQALIMFFLHVQLANVLLTLGPNIGKEMRQVPLERDINIAINGQFLVRNLHQERPFMAMLISRCRGTCLIKLNISQLYEVKTYRCASQDNTRPNK